MTTTIDWKGISSSIPEDRALIAPTHVPSQDNIVEEEHSQSTPNEYVRDHGKSKDQPRRSNNKGE